MGVFRTWGYRDIITPLRSGNLAAELCPAEARRGSGSCGCRGMEGARGPLLGPECKLGAGPETLLRVECKFGPNPGALFRG